MIKGSLKKNNCQCNICDPLEISFTRDQIKIIKKLVTLRKEIAKENRININQVMTDQVIAYISLLTPKTKSCLLKVPGIGQGWVDRWSDVIIPSV